MRAVLASCCLASDVASARRETMKEEILFMGLSLAFTSMLLLVRHCFLTGLKSRNNYSFEMRLDDQGNSDTAEPPDRQPSSPLRISPTLSVISSSFEEWPSEIAVLAE